MGNINYFCWTMVYQELMNILEVMITFLTGRASKHLFSQITRKLDFVVCLFVCFVALRPNSYGHDGTVSSPCHTFSSASLNKQLTSISYLACNN